MPSSRPLVLLLCGALAGCNVLGAVASKLPKPEIEAAYKGLAGKSVGVMVWADKSVLMDWPSLQLDTGNNIINKLLAAEAAEVKDLKGTKYPFPPASYVKYQKEHPETDVEPVTQFAGKLGVDRLIYIEVNDLSTRADGGAALFLGNIAVTMKVIEINAKGVGTVAYSEVIKSQFPDKAPKEGILNAADRTMYMGSVNAVTTEIVKRLIKHPDDDET